MRKDIRFQAEGVTLAGWLITPTRSTPIGKRAFAARSPLTYRLRLTRRIRSRANLTGWAWSTPARRALP